MRNHGIVYDVYKFVLAHPAGVLASDVEAEFGLRPTAARGHLRTLANEGMVVHLPPEHPHISRAGTWVATRRPSA